MTDEEKYEILIDYVNSELEVLSSLTKENPDDSFLEGEYYMARRISKKLIDMEEN